MHTIVTLNRDYLRWHLLTFAFSDVLPAGSDTVTSYQTFIFLIDLDWRLDISVVVLLLKSFTTTITGIAWFFSPIFKSVSITTRVCLLCRNVDNDGQGKRGFGVGGFESHAGNRALLWQLEHFAFSVCLIKCSFKELPVFTRRERDTHFHKGRETPTSTKLRSSLCCTQTGEGGREGGAVMWKRDASKVIMCFTLKGAGACQSRRSCRRYALMHWPFVICYIYKKTDIMRTMHFFITDSIPNYILYSWEHDQDIHLFTQI